MLVLEDWDRAVRRGARIRAELAGYGLCTDAAHITRPSVAGQAEAMRRALADAGMAPEEVGYINAHGTGTQANDGVETAAIKEVFGARARSHSGELDQVDARPPAGRGGRARIRRGAPRHAGGRRAAHPATCAIPTRNATSTTCRSRRAPVSRSTR